MLNSKDLTAKEKKKLNFINMSTGNSAHFALT